jgi:hypothetical protein
LAGYSGKSKYKGRSTVNDHNKRSSDFTRTAMLNQRKLLAFKFDMREAMNSKGLDPALMTTFLASVIAKGSRQGIHDAKDFVRQTEHEGYISKEVGDHVCYLLDRYTKYQSQIV